MKTVAVDEPEFEELLAGAAENPRFITLFRLESLGLLRLVGGPESRGPALIEALLPVVENLRLALQGCIAHERVVSESLRRQETEYALTMRERHFRSLIETSFDIIAVIDTSGRLLEANAAVLRILGHDPEELAGTDVRELLVDLDRPLATEAFLWLRSGGPPTAPIAIRARHLDGREVPLEITLQDLRDEEAVRGIVLTARDLTERHSVEKRLRASERLLRSMVDSALDAIVTINRNGRIVDFNPAAQHMFGLHRDTAVGSDMAELLVPTAWREAHRRGMDRFLATGEGPVLYQRIEVTALRGDGREFPVELVVVPIETGEELLFTGFIRDLSGPREAEIELAERGARLRAILETAVEGIITIDERGLIESLNRAAAQMFGFSPHELLGHNVSILMPEQDAARHDGHLARYLATGERRVIGSRRELVGRRRDGSLFPVALAVSEVELEGRHLFTGILTDITEQQRAEQELRETSLRLSTLIASLQAGVIVEDEHRHVVLANSAFCEMFRIPVPPIALIGADCRAMAADAASAFADPESFISRVEQLLESRCVITEEPVELADGRILERDSVPIVLGGDTRGHLWMYRDVTERRRAEAELAEARRREIDIGGRIQQALLLGPSPGQLNGMTITVHTVPSAGVDGDFYDVFDHSHALVDVVLGDVMGKGVPAALVAAATKSRLLRGLGHREPADPPGLIEPATLVTRVAAELVPQLIELERFVTLCYARVDLVRQRLLLVDCGHTRTIHWHAASGEVDLLKGDNVPLGFLPDETYSQLEAPLAAGDVVLFYSDGVTEASDPSGDLFGESRLIKVVQETAAVDPALLVDAILAAVADYMTGATLSDDLSVVVVHIQQASCVFHHRLPARLDALGRLRALTHEACCQLLDPPLEEGWVQQALLAVNEAFTNIVRHAYGEDSDAEIVIDIELRRASVAFELHHWGTRFDRTAVPEPSFDGSRDGGFGIFLIEHSVDTVEWLDRDDGGTTIRLVKFTDRY